MKRLVSVVLADVYNDFDCLRVTGMLARFWWVGCQPCTGILQTKRTKGCGGIAAPWK